MGLAALWHVEFSQIKDRACISCIAGGFLTTDPTREAYRLSLKYKCVIRSPHSQNMLILSPWHAFCFQGIQGLLLFQGEGGLTTQMRRKTRLQKEQKSRAWLRSHLLLFYDFCSLSIDFAGQFSLCLSSYLNFFIISNSPVTWHLLHNTQNFPWLSGSRILSFSYLCLWRSHYFLKLCANQDVFFSLFFLFLPCCAACGILAPLWGMKPRGLGSESTHSLSPDHQGNPKSRFFWSPWNNGVHVS